MHIDENGWLTGIRHVPSPNSDSRPEGVEIDLLVIHNISLPPGEFGGPYIEQLFTNRLDADEHPYFAEIADLKVSSHLLIRRDGEIVQFVSFNDRAWHAGESCFAGRQCCNDFSIGIELEGSDEIPYADVQYQHLVKLSHLLLSHYPGMSSERVTGHSDIAPLRKTDPGMAFDWPRYRQMLAAMA